MSMQIQLWSYNYDPEPQGIAPLSRMLAVELSGRATNFSLWPRIHTTRSRTGA